MIFGGLACVLVVPPPLQQQQQQQQQQHQLQPPQTTTALTSADAPSGRFAWVSTLCGDASYVPAIAVLGHSLRRSNTTHDMVLLVTGDLASDDATHAQLRRVGWKVRLIHDTLQSPVDDRGERGDQSPRYKCFFTKLRSFGLVDYEQIVLLDADTTVFQNADELFERWPRPPNEVAAVPNDRYPTVEVNTGVLVIRPSRTTADALEHHVRSGAPIEWDGADQGLINQWFFGKIDYLPPFYNMMNSASSDPYTMDWLLSRHESSIKIVHYVNNKPIGAAATPSAQTRASGTSRRLSTGGGACTMRWSGSRRARISTEGIFREGCLVERLRGPKM